jgi:hypothetical protein
MHHFGAKQWRTDLIGDSGRRLLALPLIHLTVKDFGNKTGPNR